MHNIIIPLIRLFVQKWEYKRRRSKMNLKNTFWYTSPDNVDIFVQKWEPKKQAKAVIQIAHGMMEHIERYENFASYLTSQGFIVYGNDHRGHGRTGERQGKLGYFADSNGFFRTADDLVQLSKQIKASHPTLPLFLIGHSMGSFLIRIFIQKNSSLVDGAILSGTGHFPRLKTIAGKQLASFFSPKKEAPWMNKLVFGTYNKKIADASTGFEWLSSDHVTVQKYVKDPFTGFIPTGRFFFDLMEGLLTMQKTSNNKHIRHNFPLLILSGDCDPVGNYEKGIWKTARLFEKAGLESITTMVFTNGRHELLNEANKEEVYTAINSWLQANISNM